MTPLVHDLAGATVLVLGGGPVGARKARRFAREARVVVVSPTFADDSFGGAERVRAAPDAGAVPGWLERVEPALVVAATDDPAVNEAAEAAALDAGVLVNRADARGARPPGSVVVPATVRVEPLLVAVTSEGTDPAVSAAVRDRLGARLAGAQAVTEAVATVRSRLERAGVPAADRLKAVRAIARSDAVWDAARSDDGDVLAVATNEVPEPAGETPTGD